MRCPSCACECRDGAAFCDGCGARLGLACARCGTGLRPTARFCDACGQRVADAPATAPEPRAYTPRHLAEKILTSRSALQGERKQVTVLFADVKGSMDLAEQVDPEAWHGIMDGFFGILADGVHRYEGTVNQYTGDGIMALFGAPIAHEDHARRACHAALDLVAALRRYADELRRARGLSFAVRMGLNSGEVVVGAIGDDLRMDYTAQGHTVGLAARMERLAEPGRVYVTEHTAALVEGFFRLRPLGRFAVSGVRRPIDAFELEGLGALRTRLDVSRARGFSRFVGREHEMQTLDAALASAADGRGRVIGVVAEPGVGKSRLCWEFVQRCNARRLVVHQAHAVPYGKSVPYLVALELARSWFAITPQDGNGAARRKVAGALVVVDESLRDALPLVWDFLGIGDPDRPAPRLAPDVRVRRLVAVLKRVVQQPDRTEPTVLLLEDLHWMDGGSATLLEALVEAVPRSRTLVVVNFRPEYRAPWTASSVYHQLPLQPLSPTDVSALLDELLGTDPSLAALGAQIAAHTGGNPFFIEELVRGLVDNGTLAGSRGDYRLAAAAATVTIPPSVEGVLAARIDRLGERAKAVLQTAAVIGKEVPATVLARVAGSAPGELDAALRALTAAEFLWEDPGAGYVFAHPLTQEVAYRSQLSERRARVHAAVARAIAEVDGDRLNERAALLAQHWERAGDALEAARWEKRAAEWVGTSDFPEALAHWRAVRRLLDGVPETDETHALRTDAVSNILTCGARLGLRPDEKAALFAELHTLTDESVDQVVRVRALSGPAALRLMGGDPEGALPSLREAARLAEATDDRGLRLAMRAMVVLTLFVAGRFRESFALAEEGLALGPADVDLGGEVWGLSPWLILLTFRGFLFRMMGRLGDAARDLDRGAELAQAHQELEILGMAHQGYSFLAYVHGDVEAAFTHARQAVELAERIDSAFSRTQAYEALGTALVLDGRWEEARETYERALAIMRDTGTGMTDEAFYLAGLARARLGAGALAEARRHADEAVAVAERRRMLYAACEAAFARGQVLAAHDDAESWTAAERAFADALARAEESGALIMEPLIQVERARLARRRGDRAAERDALATAERLFTAMGATQRAAQASGALTRTG